MPNLEKFVLNLAVSVTERFIDGHNLKKNISNHISQIKQFTFDIHSYICVSIIK